MTGTNLSRPATSQIGIRPDRGVAEARSRREAQNRTVNASKGAGLTHRANGAGQVNCLTVLNGLCQAGRTVRV